MDDSDRLSALRADLVKRLGPKRYEMWVGTHTTLELSAGELRIGCVSSFELQWLRQRIHGILVEANRVVFGQELTISYFVQQQQSPVTNMVQKTLLHEESVDRAATSAVLDVAKPNGKVSDRPRRTAVCHSTFANFVVGKGNEIAYRTAQAVAQRVGQFGPLLIHGSTGTGKTHLLFAMGHFLRQNGARAVRMTAEQFTTEFLDALNRRTLAGFRQKYRCLDVLLVDDIQFLVNKRATFEELLTTIDSLQERGKQIVLTCDSSPQDLAKVGPELSARISGGLALSLELPDFATRRALVRRFILEMHPAIGMTIDDEIVVVIATHVTGSARHLQGAINRLVVTSQALRQPLTADLARTTLAQYMQNITPQIRLPDIQRALCEVFHLEPGQLKSPSKIRSVVEPRMLGMWLACNLTRSALEEISQFFGRRSHSTVISAQKKIERMVSRGEKISLGGGDCSVEDAIHRVQQALRRA